MPQHRFISLDAISDNDRARYRFVREWFQRERPSGDQLIAGGDWSIPVPHGVFLDLCEIAKQLKREREAAGLTRGGSNVSP